MVRFFRWLRSCPKGQDLFDYLGGRKMANEFGGQYVDEKLKLRLNELETAFEEIKNIVFEKINNC